MHTNAQCYTTAPCTGGSALPSYTITSTGSLASGTYKFGNHTLAVSGASTTYTISNSCIEFDYATSNIVVSGGAHLILDNCILYSSSGALWQGIKVNTGSSVEIKNGSVIADAIRGVWANNGANEAKFTISGSTLCHCQHGVYIAPYNVAAMTSSVQGTIFSGGALLGGGNSVDGIYMTGIGSTAAFTIGSGGVYGTNTNEFTGSDEGIHTVDTYVNITDCNMHDLNNTSTTGYGIYAKRNAAASQIYVGVYAGATNNVFSNCRVAINIVNTVTTVILKNQISSTFSAGAYTMQKAIKIENSTALVNVENNEIDNYEEHGVWLKDVSNNTANIHGNTFNLTSGFGSAASAMAIRVFETALTNNLQLHIYDNIINAGRTGIYVNHITPVAGYGDVIHDNEIYFSLPTGYPGNAYGIQVIDCTADAVYFYVTSNYCEGNGAGVSDYIRGIYFSNTLGFWCLQNHIKNCSDGIYCDDAVTLSLITCNEIEDCTYAGMFFNNIGGPSTTILYPNMTATGAPSGNFWLPDPGANRGASNGSTDFFSSTWNFSDNGGVEPEYWMPSPCFIGVGFPLYPTNIGGANDCEFIPYMRLTGNAETDHLLAELNQMYGKYADAFDNNYPDGTLNDFYTLSSFWEQINTHALDPDILPDNLKHLYASIAETNIPDLLELSHAISAKNDDAANTLLETTSPANDIEYYITRTSELYLNNINDEGAFAINDDILPEIRSIAVLNGWDYGEGVYMARAMMDTTIEFNMPEKEGKFAMLPEQKILLYPNPAKDIITLQYQNNLPVTGRHTVEICNLFGSLIKQVSTTSNTIDISSVPNGMYIVKVSMEDGQSYFVKLEIIHL